MKYLFTLFLTFCTVYCYCQIEKPTTKGNIVLGGDAGFAYNSGSSEMKLFSSDEYISSINYDQKSVIFSFEPTIGYFVADGLVVGVYHYSVSEQKGVDIKTKRNLISINPGFGYAIFLNSKVSLEPSIEYSFEKTVQKDERDFDNKNNRIFFNIGFHIFL